MSIAFVWPLFMAIALIGIRTQRPPGTPDRGALFAAVFALGALSGALAVLN
jgi:hypothetical protein